jgi:hypothetical protein
VASGSQLKEGCAEGRPPEADAGGLGVSPRPVVSLSNLYNFLPLPGQACSEHRRREGG